MTTNYLTLYEGLKTFRDAMLPFIVEKLQVAYGDEWWERGVARCFREEDIEHLRVLFDKRDSLVVERPGDELAEMLDVTRFGNIFESNWQAVFGEVFGDRKVIHGAVGELAGVLRRGDRPADPGRGGRGDPGGGDRGERGRGPAEHGGAGDPGEPVSAGDEGGD